MSKNTGHNTNPSGSSLPTIPCSDKSLLLLFGMSCKQFWADSEIDPVIPTVLILIMSLSYGTL